MNIGVILAGGIGSRFGSIIPKQYQIVNGQEVISYVINAFKKSDLTDEIIVVSDEQHIDYLQEKYGITAIKGGSARNETVFNAINFIKTRYGEDVKVIFADSARPLLASSYIDEVFNLLDEYDSVITVAKITDSLYDLENSLVDREKYRLIQTPEAFKIEALEGFDPYDTSTAILSQCKSKNIYFCDKLKNNFKITYPQDLIIASALLTETK